MNKKFLLAVAGGVVFCITTSVSAQPVGYIGAAFGQSDVNVAGYDTASSVKIFGGVNLTPYFALEGAYSNLGRFDDNWYQGRYLEVDGIEFTAVGNIPLTSSVSLFGKAGFYSWNVDVTDPGYYYSGSDEGTDLTYGAGVKLGLVEPLSLNVEYQRYSSVSGGDIDTFYLGVAYHF